MKTTLLLSIFLLSISTYYAQPNFTYADHPNIGDVGAYKLSSYDNTSGNLDIETGNNYSWNFSSLVLHPSFFAVDSFRVKTLPVSFNFPSATIEYYHVESAGVNLELYSYSNDTLYIHKTGSIIGGQPFVPKVASIKFPIAFNGTSNLSDTIFQGAFVVGLRTTEVSYDGFGTLNLPNGNNYNNVFRVKKVERDTTFSTGVLITYTNYIWYSQGGDAPLLRLSKTDFFGASGNIYTVYSRESSVTSVSDNGMELDPQIIIFPNPANHEIQVTGIANNQKYIIYSIIGEEMKKGELSASHKISLQGLPFGTYFLKVGEERILKFVKE